MKGAAPLFRAFDGHGHQLCNTYSVQVKQHLSSSPGCSPMQPWPAVLKLPMLC